RFRPRAVQTTAVVERRPRLSDLDRAEPRGQTGTVRRAAGGGAGTRIARRHGQRPGAAHDRECEHQGEERPQREQPDRVARERGAAASGRGWTGDHITGGDGIFALSMLREWTLWGTPRPLRVMAGLDRLDPAIHAFLSECAARRGWPARGRP